MNTIIRILLKKSDTNLLEVAEEVSRKSFAEETQNDDAIIRAKIAVIKCLWRPCLIGLFAILLLWRFREPY